MAIRVVYGYYDDGTYSGKQNAQIDPKSGRVLLPPNTTTLAPEIKAGYFSIFKNKAWSLSKIPTSLEDLEGVIVKHTDNSPRANLIRNIMQNLTSGSTTHRVNRNDDLDLFIEEIPPKTEEELKAEQEAKEEAEYQQSRLPTVEETVMELAEVDEEHDSVALELAEYCMALEDRINELEAKLEEK